MRQPGLETARLGLPRLRPKPEGPNAFDVHKLDFDGDGDQDLALRAGRGGAERILVLSSTPEGLVPGAAFGDVNSDGPLDVNNDGSIDLVTVTEDARGAIDERALLKVYLQGVHAYPVTATDWQPATRD